MTDREHIVAGVVAAAGGRLTSRVRLQKAVYLLDRLGLESGFDYEYYHYGPYSRELDIATADAQEFVGLREEFGYRASDGARYSVFAIDDPISHDVFGVLGADRATTLVRRFAETNVTILELAATVDWLWREEKISDWRREIEKRKNVKVQNGRLARAIELLRDLGIAPPPSIAA